MNNCDCKHVSYCKDKPETCNVSEELRHFNQYHIFNNTTKEISAMQGMKGDLKK